MVLSTAGFGLLLYGLSTIGSVGVNVLDTVLTVAGVVIIVAFFVRQLKLETPMLNVRVLANRNFLVGTVVGMLVQAALLAAGVLMPIYLQSYRGFSATLSGLVILPGAVLMGVMGIFVGRMFDKRGPRMLSIVGLGLLSASTLAFAFLGDDTNVALITVLYTVRMFSLALVNMPITTWAMNALDNSLMDARHLGQQHAAPGRRIARHRGARVGVHGGVQRGLRVDGRRARRHPRRQHGVRGGHGPVRRRLRHGGPARAATARATPPRPTPRASAAACSSPS